MRSLRKSTVFLAGVGIALIASAPLAAQDRSTAPFALAGLGAGDGGLYMAGGGLLLQWSSGWELALELESDVVSFPGRDHETTLGAYVHTPPVVADHIYLLAGPEVDGEPTLGIAVGAGLPVVTAHDIRLEVKAHVASRYNRFGLSFMKFW
jgi:hypothetical protein